jgi:hypothetical protein
MGGKEGEEEKRIGGRGRDDEWEERKGRRKKE